MKPEPKVARRVCTVCGLDWHKHGAEPTVETCVELLKAELAWNSALGATPNISYSGATPNISYSGIPLRGNDIGKAQ